MIGKWVFQWTAYVSILCRHFDKKLLEKPVTKEQMKSMCITQLKNSYLLEKKQQECKKANCNQDIEVCLLCALFFSTILLIPKAIKSSPLLRPFVDLEFWGFSLFKI